MYNQHYSDFLMHRTHRVRKFHNPLQIHSISLNNNPNATCFHEIVVFLGPELRFKRLEHAEVALIEIFWVLGVGYVLEGVSVISPVYTSLDYSVVVVAHCDCC